MGVDLIEDNTTVLCKPVCLDKYNQPGSHCWNGSLSMEGEEEGHDIPRGPIAISWSHISANLLVLVNAGFHQYYIFLPILISIIPPQLCIQNLKDSKGNL